MDKKVTRLRRSLRGRVRIKELQAVRLSVHRTPQHIYAQLIAPTGDKIIACASTLDKEIKSAIEHGGNIKAAKLVGNLIAKRAKENKINKVAFDRSGFKYHGRIKALADAAREGGIEF